MNPHHNQAVFQAESEQEIEKIEREAQERKKEEMRKCIEQEASDHQMIDLSERLHYAQGCGEAMFKTEQQSLPVRSLPTKQQGDKKHSPESGTAVATLPVCDSKQLEKIHKLTMCQDPPIYLKLQTSKTTSHAYKTPSSSSPPAPNTPQ